MTDASGLVPAANMKVDGQRLWDSLMQMARIGPGVAGGNNRQTLTDSDAEGRALFRRWCEDAGMTMGLDRMGNMFMRHEGAEPDLDPVYIGSHLDTQPTGGKFDGVLGVLAGLEVIRSIRDMGKVMGWLSPRTRGRADGKVVSGMVVAALARADLAAHDDVGH